MLKTICIAALTTVMSLATAYGAGTPKECTDAHMKQMDAMIAKMTDAAKKKEATTALDMSKAEMKKGNMEGCMKHMKEAHTAMGLH
jgi:hypothetical protein